MPIKFCPIYPAFFTHMIEEDQGVFILAQHVKDREKWRDVCASHSYSILDNGEAEGERIEQHALVSIALDIRPTYIVAPDVFGDANGTITSTTDFMHLYASTLRKAGIKIAVVPHGQTRQGWYVCLRELIKLKPDMLCLPKRLPGGREWVLHYGRYELDAYNLPIHMLGMTSQSELLFTRRVKNIVAIDSAMPIWYGMMCKEMPFSYGDDGKKDHMPRGYFKKRSMSVQQEGMIKHNIEAAESLLREAVDGGL